MTSERAKYILSNVGRYGEMRWAFDCPLFHKPFFTGWPTTRNPVHGDGITEGEWEYIKIVWSMLENTASVHTAVQTIAGTT